MATIADNLYAALGDPDEWIWGIEAIAREANLFKQDEKTGESTPHVRRAAHMLSTGAIAGRCVKGRDKNGKEHSRGQWVSTRGLIRNSLLPETS